MTSLLTSVWKRTRRSILRVGAETMKVPASNLRPWFERGRLKTLFRASNDLRCYLSSNEFFCDSVLGFSHAWFQSVVPKGEGISNDGNVTVNSAKVTVTQSCPALCDPMDCIVPGIIQARILEWVTFPFSRGSSQPRNQNGVSWIAGGFFTNWVWGKPINSE